jgi:bifunctional DNase/RNase
MKDNQESLPMVRMELGRIVIREGSEQQLIYLREVAGPRGFPIVIGTAEACEIRRVVHQVQSERPLTHQLAFETIRALGANLQRVEIVDLKHNTFFARLVLAGKDGTVNVDARPSDALALALRAHCPVHVAEHVLTEVRNDKSGPDALPEPEQE